MLQFDLISVQDAQLKQIVNVLCSVLSPAKHFVSNINAKLILITIYFRVLTIGISI